MPKRVKTKYPGVYYRDAERIGGTGIERVYYIVFKKDGKTCEEKAGRQYADDMTPARAAHIRGERIEGKRQSPKELRKAVEERKKAEEGKWTIDRLWAEYKRQKPDLKGIATDESRYQKHIKPDFGDKEPQNILQLNIDRLRIVNMKKRSPQTVKHILGLLKRIIKFGRMKGLCQNLPFAIEMPSVNNVKTEDLNPEQLNRLMKVLDEFSNPLSNLDHYIHAANMMKIALFTGMRRGELFKLQWKDIDFERGFIYIRDPKGGPSQVIPLNDGARAVLTSHIETGSPYVFPGKKGGLRTTISKPVNEIKKLAGLPEDFRPLHGLRHVYASMLASSGEVDLYVLQKLLTHKDHRMTQRYAHLRDFALKRAAGVADNIFNDIEINKKEVRK